MARIFNHLKRQKDFINKYFKRKKIWNSFFICIFYLTNTCKYFHSLFLAAHPPKKKHILVHMASSFRKDVRHHFITCSSQTLYNILFYSSPSLTDRWVVLKARPHLPQVNSQVNRRARAFCSGHNPLRSRWRGLHGGWAAKGELRPKTKAKLPTSVFLWHLGKLLSQLRFNEYSTSPPWECTLLCHLPILNAWFLAHNSSQAMLIQKKKNEIRCVNRQGY